MDKDGCGPHIRWDTRVVARVEAVRFTHDQRAGRLVPRNRHAQRFVVVDHAAVVIPEGYNNIKVTIGRRLIFL